MAAEWMETQRGIVTEDDIDFNRHMSVKSYFPKFDDAAFFLIRNSGLFYGDLQPRNIGLATVLHKIQYLAELSEGDPYNIESAFVSIGRRSLRYVQKMNNLRTGHLAASFDTIEACSISPSASPSPGPTTCGRRSRAASSRCRKLTRRILTAEPAWFLLPQLCDPGHFRLGLSGLVSFQDAVAKKGVNDMFRMHCANCGAATRDNVMPERCASCGAPLPPAMMTVARRNWPRLIMFGSLALITAAVLL